MLNDFSKPGFVSGIGQSDDNPPEDTNDRSWGTFAADTAIGLAKPIVGAARTVTQAARMGLDAIPKEDRPEFLGDAAHGPVADVDRSLGGAEKWLEDKRSARDKALDTDTPFPGKDDRSFWREPVAATIHQAVPLVPMIAGAVLTGGTSLAAEAGTAATFGILGVGSSLNSLRDAADNMPVDQLKQLPQWHDFGGDIDATRNQVFKDSVDLKTEAATAIANGLTFGAFLQGIGSPAKKLLAQRLKSMFIGGAEGTAVGAAQGAVNAYGEQLGKVRRGEQENIDPAAIATDTERGTAFGPVMAAHHFISPHRPGAAPADKPPPPKLDTDVTSTLSQALQPDAPLPETPPLGSDTGVPGPQQAPSAPLPPQFPSIERPGMPQPGDFPPTEGAPPSPPGPPPIQPGGGPPPPTPAPPPSPGGEGGGGAPVPPPVVTPTAPLRPRFASIEQPGLPSPHEFGAEPETAVPSSPAAVVRGPAPAEAAPAVPARPAPVVAREEPAAGSAALRETPARVAGPEVAQGGGEGEVRAVTPEVKPKAEAQPAREKVDTVSTPAAEGTTETTLGARLSEDAQAHMTKAHEQADKAHADRLEKAAAVRRAPTADPLRRMVDDEGKPITARVREGKVKTGVERALETSIKAWKASTTKTVETWARLRRQAINAEAERVNAGLKPKGYLKDIGPRPETEQRIYPYQQGLERIVPTSATSHIPMTPEEATFASRVGHLHARNKETPLSTIEHRAAIRPLLAEARRLDAARFERGQPAMFEKALPKGPEARGTLDHQFNDLAHELELYRDLSPQKFVRHHAVASAIQRMQAINDQRLGGERRPIGGAAFRPEPAVRPLPVPDWVTQKYRQAREDAPNFIQHEPYARAVAELNNRQRLPTTLPTGAVEVRRMASEATAAGQKHDIGVVYPAGGATPGRAAKPPLTAAAHERVQEAHRKAKAPTTELGAKLRREAEREQTELKPHEAREAAKAQLEKEQQPQKRQHLGELPTEEEINKQVDEFFAKKEGAEATGTTREKHTALREFAIKSAIDEALKKHFGEQFEGLRAMIDRLEIGLPPMKSAELQELEAQGVTGGRRTRAIRAGKPVAPRELVSRPKRGSALSAAALKEDVVKRIMEIAGVKEGPTVSKAQAAALGVDAARFGMKLEAEEKPRNIKESFRQLREEHESALQDWQNKVFDQVYAGYEVKPLLDDIVRYAEHFTKGMRENRNIKGSSIATWIPKGREARTSDGRIYMKYNAGHAQEKASHFNMLADLMNAREQIRLAQSVAPKVEDFDHMSAVDTQRVVGQLIPELSKLGRDWRYYEGGLIHAINEERRVQTQEIDTVKRGQKTETKGEEGEDVTPEQFVEQAASPEQQLIEREGPQPESEYDRRARERRETREWQEMIAAQPAATQVKGARVVGTRAKGAYEKEPLTEERPPSEGRKLTGAELEEAKARLLANRRNRPTDGPPPETAGEYRAEVQSAREALATDDPQHPLISDSEPGNVSLDRAKAILERGEGGDVSGFITPEFIDKLSKVNEGVRVLHAPVEVVAGERGEGQAFYQPDKDRIVLSNNVSSGDYVKNVVHEHVHAATEHLLDSDAAFRSEVEDLRQRAEDHAKQAGVTNQRLLYGLQDAHEFLSESQSNPEFRALLSRASAPGRGVIAGAKNVMNALYRTVRDAWRRVMGERDGDTALDVLFRDKSTVLGRTDRLVGKTLGRLAMEGRQPGRTTEGRRYSPLTDKVSSAVKQAGKDAWSTIAQAPRFDLGMSLHSTIDLTHRGGTGFQELASKLADIMSRKDTERGRIIKEEDRPKLLKTAKWLNGLTKDTRAKIEKFLTDETMHGAYADVALNDPKNKHISLDEPFNPQGQKQRALRDVQIHRMHEGMRERYNELTAIPGFVEQRNALHKFFHDRETEIRDVVSKAMIEHLDVLPASADTPTKKAAATELIQKHVLQEKMTDAEKAQLNAIKGETKNFDDIVSRIRRTPELNRLAGPYLPLTRRGSWAVFGRFKMGEGGANGERPVPERDTHGRDVDEGVRMFDTREAAEAFEKRMQESYGMSQLDGGEWYIDTSTGKRARDYSEEELRQMRANDPDSDLRSKLVKADTAQGAIDEFGDYSRFEKKYFVKMQPKLLEFHDSRSEADASAAAWRAKHGDNIDVTNAEQVHRGSGKENEKYASVQLQKLIDRVEQTDSFRQLGTDQQTALKSALTLQAAKLSLRRGIRQQFKPREYVAGVNPDNLMHNFADYSGQTAGYLANTRHYVETGEATKALDEFMAQNRYEKDPTSTLRQRLRDELYRRLNTPAESNVNTPFDKGVDTVLKMSMFSRLAGFSYYAINSTEPVALGAPIMMDRHGPGKVYAKMAQVYRMIGPLKMASYAVKDAISAMHGRVEEFDANGNPTVYTDYKKVFADAIAKQPDHAGLEDFIEQVQKRGLFESSASIEYQRMIQGPSVPTSKFDKAQNWASNVFQGANTAVENLNRFVTGVTAYKLERARLGDVEGAHQKAVDYATDVMYRTNGDYRNWNSPTLLSKTPIGKLAGQYKKYPQRVLASYIEGAAASLKLFTKEGRTEENIEKARRLAGMTAVQIGAAGVLGLPTEILKIPMNALYLSGVTNVTADDAENWFRGQMLSTFGPMGQVISDGVSRLTPVDIGGRMSMSNTLFFGSPTSRKPGDVMGAAVGVILGSGGTMARDTLKGIQLLSQSAKAKADGADAESYKLLMQGLRYTIPVRALADALAATEADVSVSPSGRPLRQPLSTGDSVIRALGFQSTAMTTQREAHDRVKATTDRYTAERNRLIQEWVASPVSQRASVQKEINDFNRNYSKGVQRITREDQLKAVVARQKAQKTPTGDMGLSLNTRTRPFLQEEPSYGAARR